MSTPGNHDAGANAAKENGAGAGELERMVEEAASPEQVCLKLAQILGVRRHEVALLRLDKRSLNFIFPAELRGAGAIPLSGAAVAARTATARTPLVSNSFARVKHANLFESVKLNLGEEDRQSEQMPIQKIMSVPVLSEGKVLGVVQISRKGWDSSLAGTDFCGEDLKRLEQAAEVLAHMAFMQDGAKI